MSNVTNVIISSTYNLELLSRIIPNYEPKTEMKASILGSGDVYYSLLQELQNFSSDTNILFAWYEPQKVIPSFADVLQGLAVPLEKIFTEVDTFSNLMISSAKNVKFILLIEWKLFPNFIGSGLNENKNNSGITNILTQMNLRLSQNLSSQQSISIINSSHWIEELGINSFNFKMAYLTKNPFSNDLLKLVCKSLFNFIYAIEGKSKKLIILDLDDTLWGGILGDVGVDGLKLGGHDYIGEAHQHFQKELKKLKNKGILLAICSKNNEETALDAIKNHPEMVLRLNDFVAWRINWDDKAKNIKEMVEDLNLGLQSVVFIDDSVFERNRVREALPEIFVPEWTADKTSYVDQLHRLGCFDSFGVSEEDQKRTQSYLTEKNRTESKDQFTDLDSWLSSLELSLRIEPLKKENLLRITQLLNKTNQMNLLTRRMTEVEITDWASKKDHFLYSVRVEDKYGDSGLTGIVSFIVKERVLTLTDFVLSCRVMGRKVEEAILNFVSEKALELGCQTVVAPYIQTPKNKPCFDLFSKLANYHSEKSNFSWNLPPPFEKTTFIKMKYD
jgi:FkbH-like protein